MCEEAIKFVCNKVWDIEKKYDLFNKQINEVYFWKLVRFNIYKAILEDKKIYGQAHSKVSSKFIDKLLYLPKALVNTHLYGALKRNSKKDFLVFEHPRKVKVNGEYIDKYTHYLVDDLKEESYEIIDKPYLRKHYNNPSDNRSYFEHFSFIDYLKRKIFTLKIDEANKSFIIELEKELEKTFDIKIDLLQQVKFKITHFKNEVEYYDILLKKRKPKKVFLVVSYGSEALIEACRLNNVISIEIQHGTINKYHLGYSFPNNTQIPYFPDQIYLFGRYWADSTPLPLAEKDLYNYGFPYLEKRLEDYKEYSKKKNKVLFISQGTISARLSEIAYDFAKHNPDYEVIYKLHPGEYDRWQNEYKYLNRAAELSNFEIIDCNDIHLYQLFAESEF
ncbi:MAG: hypothetical protein ACOCUI_04315, partial [bacterium]